MQKRFIYEGAKIQKFQIWFDLTIFFASHKKIVPLPLNLLSKFSF